MITIPSIRKMRGAKRPAEGQGNYSLAGGAGAGAPASTLVHCLRAREGLACHNALAMRRRHLRRKRIERVATWTYHACAALGFTFILALIIGAI